MKRPITMKIATLSAAAALLLAAGCTTNAGPTTTAMQQKQSIEDGVQVTMKMLYASVPGSGEMARKASGVLVFPNVYAAGLLVGGEYGRGALEIDGRTAGYYKTTGLSVGLQAGAESKGLVFMFMTRSALDRFLAGDGWTAGVDASVAVVDVGANGTADTMSTKADVAAFALTNSGLMAAVNLEGIKVTKLDLGVTQQ